MVVDRAQLLVALPRDRDVPVRVAGLQARVDLAGPSFGQVLGTVPQQRADLVERVVFAAAVPERGLLHALPALVECLHAEPDDVERVQHCDRVGQLVPDRVRVPAERVQCGMLHRRGEARRRGAKPGRVRGAGPAGHHVQQLRADPAGVVAGQVDHRGDRPVLPATGWLPDVLVHAERDHPVEPVRVLDQVAGVRLDGTPEGVPADPEPTRQRGDGGVIGAEHPVAHATARPVSLARAGSASCCSVTEPTGQPGCRHRQSRLRHRTHAGRPNAGASASSCTRRPWPSASTPQPGQPTGPGSVSTSSTITSSRTSTATTCTRSIANTPQAGAHEAHPEIGWDTSRSSVGLCRNSHRGRPRPLPGSSHARSPHPRFMTKSLLRRYAFKISRHDLPYISSADSRRRSQWSSRTYGQ